MPVPTPSITPSVSVTPVVTDEAQFTYKYPRIESVGSTTASALVSIDDVNGNAWGVVIPKGDDIPTTEQIKNGQDASGASLPSGNAASLSLTADTPAEMSFSNMSDCTRYLMFIAAEDSDGGEVNHSPARLTLTTKKISVVPSHIATYPKVENITVTGFDVLVKIDAIGRSFAVVLEEGADEPSIQQIREGRNAIGLPVPSGSFAKASMIPDVEARLKIDTLNEAGTKNYDLYVVSEKKLDINCPDKIVQTADSPVKIVVEIARPF